MPARRLVVATTKWTVFSGCLAVILGVALTPWCAFAEEAAAPPIAPQPRMVGGHIGVATSFATIGTTTDTISDRVPLVIPVGISVHTSPNVVVDFETQVVMLLHPVGATNGATKFNVDPGIVYNFGPAAVGLRVLFPINATSPGTTTPVAAVGAIPLINKGFADLGFGTWFVEAAFPFTVYGSAPGITTKATLDLVLHTGIGF